MKKNTRGGDVYLGPQSTLAFIKNGPRWSDVGSGKKFSIQRIFFLKFERVLLTNCLFFRHFYWKIFLAPMVHGTNKKRGGGQI